MRCRRTGLRWRRLDHGLRVEGIRGGDRLDRRIGVDDLGHEPLVRVELGLVGGDVGAGALARCFLIALQQDLHLVAAMLG